MKILDPVADTPTRVLDSQMTIAVVWVPARLRPWLARELAFVGVTPLLAVAFRHVSSSLHPAARPRVSIAIIDFDSVTADVLCEITSLRWRGYRGVIVGISSAGTIAAKTLQIAAVDAVVRPLQALGTVLGAYVAKS